MASTTPNIGLTLPTGAEKVSRQVINTNNTIIDSKMGAVPDGKNLQGEIDALNSKMTTKTAVSVTAGTNVVIDVNRTYLCGDTLFIYVKGHATAAISNSKLFEIDTPANILQSGSIFALTYGSEWGVEGITYGYLGQTSVTGNVTSGKYFDVNLCVLINR